MKKNYTDVHRNSDHLLRERLATLNKRAVSYAQNAAICVSLLVLVIIYSLYGVGRAEGVVMYTACFVLGAFYRKYSILRRFDKKQAELLAAALDEMERLEENE
jgi:Flp pilus assembly protein TadB